MHCGIECKSSACVFEYIYFARPDSIIDGASVELARQEAGKYLSIEHPVGADVVIGVPDSGIPQPSATRSSPAFRTASVSSRTAISPAPLSSRVRTSASAPYVSS